MKVEFLGTGGSVTIPRVLCKCEVCNEAREKGVPFSRMGPGIFVHGPNLLIDTSEDIYQQINRSKIDEVEAIIYSHWHPDHVMGRRVLEALTADYTNHPPTHKEIDVYLPQQVEIDFKTFLGTGDHLNFMAFKGYAKLNRVQDGESFSLNDTKITPFRLAEDYVYAFMLESKDKKILIAVDELKNWKPEASMRDIDLAVLPVGIFEVHPLTGKRILAKDHPLLQVEATFMETLEVIKELDAKRVILTHIDEPNGLGYNDLQELEAKLKAEGLQVEFAYDTQIVDVES